MAAFAGLASQAQGQIQVGGSGSGILTFDSLPASTDWSTLSAVGGAGDVATDAGLDTAMSTISASTISATLGSQAGSGTSGNAYWRSGDQMLGTQPTGNKMTLLLATLENSSGSDVGGLVVAYDLGQLATPAEQLKGHRVYWSKTGTADSWTAAGDCLWPTVGTTTVSLNLEMPMGWAAGETLYVVWADDNGEGTEGIFTIDNVSFAPSSPSANILSFNFGSSGPATINNLNITATVLHGTDVTNLAPTYNLSYGATCNKASGSTQDLTNPVQYVVTSSDNLVSQIYTVTLTVLPAGIIYQESFSTGCASANFAGTYPGFSQAGPLWNVSASGYASTDTAAAGTCALWRTMTTYDWVAPLTVSAEVGATDAAGGQSLGIFFSNSQGYANAGLTFRPFISSNTHGANISDARGDNRGTFGVASNRDINPDVPQGEVLTKISLTLRQSTASDSKFDWLAMVNDTEVWTSVADGGDGTSGWHTGISKSVLNASGGLSTFGVACDGLTPRVDNLTVSLAEAAYQAEILSFGLPGYPGVITGTAIAWTVPFSLDATSLAPTFTLSPAATADPVSGTPRDFTTPQSYVITSGGGGATSKTYTVTVAKAPASTAKDILRFTAAPGLPAAEISGTNINVTVPLAMDVTSLAPTYTVSPLAMGSPASGTTLDFSTPQTYTVTAEDGSFQDYTVTVTQGAIPLYQESFDAACTAASFAATYPGFSQTGAAVYVSASGYASTDVRVAYGGFWRTMAAYDWSNPLTVSAEIGAVDGNGGQSIGVFFGNASGLTSAGITFRPYIPSTSNGAFVGTAEGNNRTSFGISGNRGIDPDVAGTEALTRISLTIRENALDNTKFDWLATVNDTEVWTAAGDGGDGTSGWHTGIAKSVLNASGGLSTFGVGYDGVTPRISNLTLEHASTTVDFYGDWVATIPGFTDTDPAQDPDGDGLINQGEFAFGLDPTTGTSVNPITAPLDKASHKFSYTRYAASGLSYTVWISTDLQTWSEDTGAVQTPRAAADGVETVEVTLSPPAVGNKLFVRVQAQ